MRSCLLPPRPCHHPQTLASMESLLEPHIKDFNWRAIRKDFLSQDTPCILRTKFSGLVGNFVETSLMFINFHQCSPASFTIPSTQIHIISSAFSNKPPLYKSPFESASCNYELQRDCGRMIWKPTFQGKICL